MAAEGVPDGGRAPECLIEADIVDTRDAEEALDAGLSQYAHNHVCA
jgi:hypothetical protein